MSAATRERKLSAAMVLAAGLLSVSVPVAAQTGVEVRKGAKAAGETTETALDRLLDGWREARRDTGEEAQAEAVAQALVDLMHQPIKRLELEHLDLESQRSLKGAVTLAEERVRAVGAALSRGAMDETAARAAAQRTVDEYLSVLRPFIEANAALRAGARRH